METRFNVADFYEKCGCMTAPRRTVRCDTANTDCTDPLTMVFINMRPINGVYPLDKAFCRGTLFPELDKPWMVGGDCCE